MGPIRDVKPHAVCVPFPAQGHVNPFMQLAKLLHSKGFHITFVNTEFNHNRLIQSKGLDSVKGLPDFRYETIPDGLPPPPSFDKTQEVPSLCDSTRKNCLGSFKELLCKLNSSSSGVPPVSCIISDGIMSFCIKAAEEFNIPQVQFWTASACSFMAYLHYTELEKRGLLPYKVKDFLNDGISETPIEWIPGMTNIRLKDTPLFINTSNDEIMYDFLGKEAWNCLNSSSIIFNTFEVFEFEVLKAVSDKFSGKIYTIGPLNLLERNMPESNKSKSFTSSLWKEDSNCLEWLDKQESNSVVYVNYGSITTMTEQHLKEFAWGLANSKHPFLWIVRNDIVKSDSAILDEEFLEEIEGRGLLATWCQQGQVLAHGSVGAFLTHCGWNSMMEAVSYGVPMICWPFFADQQTNCRYACITWGIGMEVNHDVKRDEIESLVKEMMEGENGKKKRERALEWKEKAEAAISNAGSSYNDFNGFIKEALHCDEHLIE